MTSRPMPWIDRSRNPSHRRRARRGGGLAGIAAGALWLAAAAGVSAADLDSATRTLAEGLKEAIAKAGVKSAAVLDFTEVEGATPLLGRLVSEETAVQLVSSGAGFSVVDRANLQKLMAEHQLTSTGLVDPDNARKLGKIAGVEAIVIGTIAEVDNSFRITAKVINTETAQIVGAARAMLDATDSTREMFRRIAGGTGGGASFAGGSGSGGAAADKRYSSQRVGPFKLTPTRVYAAESTGDSGAVVVDVEVVNESTEPATLFAGCPEERYNMSGRQKLAGSFDTTSGHSLPLRSQRGFQDSEGPMGGRTVYEGLQRFVSIDPRQSATVTFAFGPVLALNKVVKRGTMHVEVRAVVAGKNKQDVVRSVVFKDLEAEQQ